MKNVDELRKKLNGWALKNYVPLKEENEMLKKEIERLRYELEKSQFYQEHYRNLAIAKREELKRLKRG